MCFVSVLCVLFEIVDHGGPRGNTSQALAQWRHPVASSEARDVLHGAMRLASYRRVCINLLSDHEARFLSGRIYATIGVKLLSSYKAQKKSGRISATIAVKLSTA